MREKARVLAAPSHAFNLPYYLPYLDARVQAQGAGFWVKDSRFRVSEVPACPNCSATVRDCQLGPIAFK